MSEENLLSNDPIELKYTEAGESNTPDDLTELTTDESPQKRGRSRPPKKDVPAFAVFKLNPEASVPTLATEESLMFDIRACLSIEAEVKVFTNNNIETKRVVKSNLTAGEQRTGFWLNAGERALIPTGLQFQIDKGYGVMIYPKSGLSLKHGVNLANRVGVIDADYTDEVFVMLSNDSAVRYFVETGIKIAQLFVVKTSVIMYEVPERDNPIVVFTSRSGGFGSTGDK